MFYEKILTFQEFYWYGLCIFRYGFLGIELIDFGKIYLETIGKENSTNIKICPKKPGL